MKRKPWLWKLGHLHSSKSSKYSTGDCTLSRHTYICKNRQYVQDVFANCLSNKRDQAELQLRNLILEAHKAGTLLTTDWSEMDLPRYVDSKYIYIKKECLIYVNSFLVPALVIHKKRKRKGKKKRHLEP